MTQPTATDGPAPVPVRSWRAFAEWGLVGVGSMWASWTILGYGWVIALVTAGYAVKLALAQTPGPSSWGFVAGLGLVPMYVGGVNLGATQSITPWVWGASGVALVVVGLVGFRWREGLRHADNLQRNPDICC